MPLIEIPTQQFASETSTRETFRELMLALSYPGAPRTLPIDSLAADHAAMRAIGWALLDLETSYCARDPGLDAALRRTGARAQAIEKAGYVFAPHVDERVLADLERVSVGTFAYPDRGATVVVGASFGSEDGSRLGLSGPGLSAQLAVRIGGLPDGFWRMRARLLRYPLGFDLFLVSGNRLMGLPRTTSVEGYI